METIKVLRKNVPVFVRPMKVGELDKSKCSAEFLSQNFPDDLIVNIKCNTDGTLDLRGNKEQYRFIIPDSIQTTNNNEQQKEIQDDTPPYLVHVICWDGREYKRKATKDEIDIQREKGFADGDGYSSITFDFQSEPQCKKKELIVLLKIKQIKKYKYGK